MSEFEPAEPRVSEGDSVAVGSCNVYGCGTTEPHTRKVWTVDLGQLTVRLCRRHAAAVRARLPRT